MSARFYAPGLGTFTQLDTDGGKVANPLSMNRFLYALGNPATFIDPTGHRPLEDEDVSGCTPTSCQTGPSTTSTSTTTSSTSTTTNATANSTASASTSAPHVNNAVTNPCVAAGSCGPHIQMFAGAQGTIAGCNPVLSVNACRGLGSGPGLWGDPDDLAFAQGMCNATICGLVDAAAHPVQTAGGLAIMAANGIAPGLVDAVAPDLSVKHMATEFAARVRNGDPEALGELTGMGMMMFVGGADSAAARGATAGAPADDLAAVESYYRSMRKGGFRPASVDRRSPGNR
jgi:hypothetical protein